MDILNILEQLKQKGLDVVQIELLKNAYELQNRNIEQLRENNAAFKEANELLKEKNRTLEVEIQRLINENNILRKTQPANQGDLTNEAIGILKLCKQRDISDFHEQEMISNFGKGEIIGKKALGELFKKKFILQSYAITDSRGAGYRLAQPALEYIAMIQ